MIDIIGAMSLTALFGLCCAVLITAGPVAADARLKAAVVALAWFACIGVLGATGIFSATAVGTPAIAVAILTPIALFLFAAVRSPAVRNVALNTPLPVLVGIHAGRVLGVFFLLLFEAGRLPPTFARAAGWGDIAVAAAALPLAWAIQRQISGWRPLTLAWNLLGFADLLVAVTLGVGSAPGSPVRFIFESPHAGAVAALPWVMIPAVLVPMYLLSHIAIFAQLAAAMTANGARQGRGLVWESSAR
jgi:hypothetical protein